MIFFSQGFLTDDGLHSGCVLGGSVVGVKLVGYWGMVSSVLLNSFLHESGKRGQDVNGRVDLFVVELSVNEDLSFSDVASQIWDRVSDIVILK